MVQYGCKAVADSAQLLQISKAGDGFRIDSELFLC